MNISFEIVGGNYSVFFLSTLALDVCQLGIRTTPVLCFCLSICPAWIRTMSNASKGRCVTITPQGKKLLEGGHSARLFLSSFHRTTTSPQHTRFTM